MTAGSELRPTATHAAGGRAAQGGTAAADDFDILPFIEGLGALVAGTANVIMQLSWPGVGYGVLESTVDSGKVTLHPIKRFRTTFTYLSVATMGDDELRSAYRDAVNTSHRQVRSGPDSPVKYNAFDPELQRWVAACIHYGFVDVYQKMHGPLDDTTADKLFRFGQRFGTTLQMRPDMWPADRAAFESYWDESLAKVRIDPPVRDYLTGLMQMSEMPWLIRRTRAKANVLFTTGFLPPEFREAMGLSWTERDQCRFDRRMRVVSAVNAVLPGPIRRLPFNYFLWDVRMRIRRGRPLV